LSSVDNSIAEIKSSSDINISNQNINVMEAQATTTLKGDEDGKLKIDMNTGMTVKADSKISIKGNIETVGKEVPITLNIIKTVKQRNN
jgi:hypothetical protein